MDDNAIFTKRLLSLDLKSYQEKRKISLMPDNCSVHKDLPVLKAIGCVFHPPNATAKLQTFDKEIIQCLKVHYRKEYVNKLVSTNQKNFLISSLFFFLIHSLDIHIKDHSLHGRKFNLSSLPVYALK